MRGWTIQTEEWFRALDGHRVYGLWKFVDSLEGRVYRDFLAWLTAEGLWDSRRAPIWFWAVYSETSRVPDLRRAGHLDPGTRGVRLEIEYPPGFAVYTCFQRWCRLMGDVLSGASTVDLIGSSTYRHMVIAESAVCRRRDPDWGGQIQGFLPWLDPSWIRRTTHFTAR